MHRDIKPENLVFDENGYLRLTDFGISSPIKEDNSELSSGTLGYVAPEVLCKQNQNHMVDYFALGVVMFECIMKRLPYKGLSNREVREKMISTEVVLRNNSKKETWSKESFDFVNKLLKRKPTNRLGFEKGISELKGHPWFSGFDW
eukprot:CAMPEP_0170519624 /NCGR_PEP_ID=MMETSP0209-20121228/4976_1 /TAXON_ID=665100 ORGANISM="Litonotus pictus, Strain P1" /NCGR_SAMPLE_ID=MMETSP0209 /ASSEMBLY_ACC=CAM_ASM_000301 /LENGTH=145 /DNA_ID=CAMNT_0010805561 /DNA_START=437 /DNA_END=871 /DNA_ORIENTATION=+